MEHQKDDRIQIDRIVLSGIILLILGIIVIIFATRVPIPASSVFSDVGTGLIGAGILTIVLERANRNRHERDVLELKEAHFESILKGLMPEPIFKEIQAHIIRQPFLRRNVSATIELRWLDETKEYLRKSSTAMYELENISKTLEVYKLRVSGERVNKDKFPDGTRIEEIKIQDSPLSEPVVYKEEKLKPFLEISEQFVRLQLPVNLQPGQKVKIYVRITSILTAKDIHSLVMNKPTIGLDLTVSHPRDIIVSATPVHPSAHAFVTIVDSEVLKRYRLDAGILPFQGIELSWWPKKSDEPEDND